MTDFDMAVGLGIFHLCARARSGDEWARALCYEVARLYTALVEPLPELLREFAPAPTEYVQTGSNEIIREDA